MKNTINLTINNNQYANIPVEIARAIESMVKPYEVNAVAKSDTKAKKSADTKAETKKQYAKVYKVAKDGKSVTVGSDEYIPTKVFKGVTYSLKLAGAKYNKDTKAWDFGTKKACTDWCKAQDAR